MVAGVRQQSANNVLTCPAIQCYNPVVELSLGGLVTLPKRRVMSMITYAELFQFGMLIVAVVALCLKKRKK